MRTDIKTPTREELDARTARFQSLQPMSTAKDLSWVPLAAMDIVYARKLMPVILEDTKNPFGNQAPIIGAAGMTMFVSILPPGQGPCLHSQTVRTRLSSCSTAQSNSGSAIRSRIA